MAVYWLTFRIHQDAGATTRRDKLEGLIGSSTPKWWREPTSFILFESERDIDSLARSIKAQIDPKVDLVLIGMPFVKAARIIGRNDDPDIHAMIPFVTEV